MSVITDFAGGVITWDEENYRMSFDESTNVVATISDYKNIRTRCTDLSGNDYTKEYSVFIEVEPANCVDYSGAVAAPAFQQDI